MASGRKKTSSLRKTFPATNGLRSPIYIRTSDQFIPLLSILLNVVGPTMLAVPSMKLDWSEEP